MKQKAETNQQAHFKQFQQGNEKGLGYFYHLLYPSLYHWSFKYIKDDVNADCIVSEAFLRLWLVRKTITMISEIECFLKKLISDGCKAYYKTSKHGFHRNLLRLDEIENYQEFMCGFDPFYEDDPDIFYQQDLEDKHKQQWEEVQAVIPNLPQAQQVFIQLCLKYSFSYERIAWHIGGISDYQVAQRVEKMLKSLKAIISDSKKLNTVGTAAKIRFEGDLNEEQSAILNMRYELQYSFAEIAAALNLNQGYIQKVFANTCTKIKKVKL
jgi:RNA polymerase sigma factor (sigma-70 family)